LNRTTSSGFHNVKNRKLYIFSQIRDLVLCKALIQLYDNDLKAMNDKGEQLNREKQQIKQQAQLRSKLKIAQIDENSEIDNEE